VLEAKFVLARFAAVAALFILIQACSDNDSETVDRLSADVSAHQEAVERLEARVAALESAPEVDTGEASGQDTVERLEARLRALESALPQTPSGAICSEFFDLSQRISHLHGIVSDVGVLDADQRDDLLSLNLQAAELFEYIPGVVLGLSAGSLRNAVTAADRGDQLRSLEHLSTSLGFHVLALQMSRDTCES
jgi:hypothetical protein